MQTLHNKALRLAQEFKRLEFELVDVLQQIDRQKLFRSLGYSSLFEYATKGLGLSESVAYGLITVSRKSVEIPELKEAIKEGVLSVSRAKVMTAALTKDNAAALIENAKIMTHRELEKEIARINPKAICNEKAKYLTEDRIGLSLSLSESSMEKLRRVQDLESQRSGRPVNMEQALEVMLDLFLEKKDPVIRSERLCLRKENSKPSARKVGPKSDPENELCSRGSEGLGTSRRTPIPMNVKHQVNQRDRGQCTFVNPLGLRCKNQRWVETHHLKPVCDGGDHSLENLATLCSGHHKMVHRPAGK